MPQIYEITDDTCENKRFAVASGYGPLPEGMPFLHPKLLERMIQFWKVNPMAPGLSIEPGGRYWPDFLGHGSSGPPFFVTRRIVESFERIRAPIARTTEMPIASIKAKALRNTATPDYFVVEACPGIAVAWDEMNVPIDGHGNPILQPYPKPWPPPVWKVRASSWAGSDLFTWKNFKSGDATDLLCTEKVKKLAEEEGWTNVRFKPLELV